MAVIFAGVFFTFSSGLYEAGLSRQTNAKIIASTGVGSAVAYAEQQMFFPRGGTYNLGWEDVEAATIPTDMYDYGGRPNTNSLDMIEAGKLAAPRVSVTNLAFWEYDFVQNLNWPEEAPGTLILDKANKRAFGKFVNVTPYKLTGIKIVIGETTLTTTKDEIAPGEAFEIKPQFIANYAAFGVSGTVPLRCQAHGVDLGARIGDEVSSSSTTVVWDIPFEVKK